MHRSGTSACTRVLNLLGCALPDELIGGRDGNELGHWESIAAVQLNDKMLASAGSGWDDWGPINDDWRVSSVRDEMIDEAGALLKEHAALGPLFALKDPRLCRLADVWLEAMLDVQIDPYVIMMVRNPLEVAESLENRDLMSQGYGQLLWLRHVIDAERLSRGQRRIVCTYDQLLLNWQFAVDRIRTGLGISFPRNSPAIHCEIDSFLSPSYRNHERPADAVLKNPGLSEWLRNTLAILLRWSESGEDEEDYRQLDAIGIEFDRSYGAFARLLLQSDAAGEVGTGSQLKRQLSSQLVEAQHASLAAQTAVTEAENKLAAQTLREQHLSTELQASLDRIEQLSATVAALRDDSSKFATLQAELSASSEQLETLEAEVARLEADSKRLTGLEAEAKSLREVEPKLAAVIADLQASLSASEGKVEDLEAEVQRLEADSKKLSELEGEIEAMHDRVTEADRDIAKLEASRDAATENVRKEQELRIEAEKLLASRRSELAQLEWKSSEYQAQLASTKSTLIQREEELAQLWKQLLEAEKASASSKANAEQERERREAAERTAADSSRLMEDLRSASSDSFDKLGAEVALMTRLLRDENMNAAAAEAMLAEEAERSAALLTEQAERLAELQQAKTRLEAVDAARIAAERKLTNRFDEIARLTTLLSEEGERSSLAQTQANWLREVAQLSSSFPKWWVIMPAKWRRKREKIRYLRRGLFNSDSYLANNPDVAAFGMDPMVHYIFHGMEEGRTWES
jgi:hypothetical protein